MTAYLLMLLIGVPLLRQWLKTRKIKRLHRKYKSEVILYSAPWCVKCHKIKALLDEQMVRYVVVNVENSKEETAEFRTLGSRILPLTLIDGFLIVGFKPEKVKQLTNGK